MSKTVSEAVECAHCGADCREDEVVLQDLHFCCTGCRTVYELLSENDLCDYYELEELSGIAPKGAFKGSYDYLNDEGIQDRLLEFTDGQTAVARLYLPAIHCSSCIWLLEHMDRLTPGILHSEVNFPKKEIRVTYQLGKQSLSQVAEFLAMLGYPPNINLSDLDGGERKQNRTLIYQLGIAAFAFGNVMLLALPEYFGTDVWLARYAPFFRYIMMILSMPVVLYSARDYFRSAWAGLRQRYINIDVPIALGISVLFIRSSYEVISGIAPGYFDSLTGLVFFLLLGRVFQAKTYEHLSFERDYRSYFPVAVTRLRGGSVGVGSALGGATYMALFGLGTIPMMFLAMFAGNVLHVSLRQRLQKMIPVVVVIIGALFILRGMGLGIPYVSPPDTALELHTEQGLVGSDEGCH